jgi:hypothetical protein
MTETLLGKPVCNEITSTDKPTIELLGLSLRHSPPLPDPIFPTNDDRITRDPEQYSKPKRVSVMYVMPALPSPKGLPPPPLGAQRSRTIPRRAAAGGMGATCDNLCRAGKGGMNKKYL